MSKLQKFYNHSQDESYEDFLFSNEYSNSKDWDRFYLDNLDDL
jgi:hypothetical protein